MLLRMRCSFLNIWVVDHRLNKCLYYLIYKLIDVGFCKTTGNVMRVRVAVLRLTTEVVVSPQTDRQSQHKHLYLLAESQFVNPRP